MQEKNMESTDCNMDSISSVISWSFDTNWAVAHGSLNDSVAVESFDDPIDESDPKNSTRKSPLILKPRAPDSGPCEIKICFKEKYEVGQVYVRSTARVYEIYCTHSPHSINEYLCTVRCGVAERDDKVLHTDCIEDVAKERGEVIGETATDGGNVVTGEDDWIKIKVPEVGRSSTSDKITTTEVNNIQDFYEATAQISDSDPCLSLTIRLLSLQDKGNVYVDEIYVFVDPVQSTDSGNEAGMAGSSAQTSLMAMFMPTLLQLSKSGVRQVQDKYASDEVLEDDKMEPRSRIIDKIDCDQQYIKPKELDKDTGESSQIQQSPSAKKCVEPKNINDSLPGHLEMSLEQLISRLSRVEDICLRFEEKMVKPIESIEARLQRVENQLENLVKNSHNFGLPRCTRISAPAFSCSESNSSSFYNDQSDHPPRGASDLEKKEFLCNSMSKSSHDANLHPGLVVSAPEFSCDEGEEENDDFNPLKDSPCIKPKKTLSVNDALAAALAGFLSTAAIKPSEQIQTTLGLSSQVNGNSQYQGHAESCQIKAQEFPAAENGNRELPQYAQVLTVKAPEFIAEETGNEEDLNYTQSSLEMASVTENEDDHGDEMVPSSIQSNSLFASADSCDFGKNEIINGDSPAVCVNVSRTCLGNGHLMGTSGVYMIDSYFEGESSKDCAPDIAKDSLESGRPRPPISDETPQISDETNSLEKSTRVNPDDQDNASEQVVGHESLCVPEVPEQDAAVERYFKDDTPNVSKSSRVSLLDFEFPILEVKFTSDMHTSTKSPLEALLDGAAESNSEASSVDATGNDDGDTDQSNAVVMDANETTDLLPINSLLADLQVSAADDSSHSEGMSHNLSTPNSPGMNESLI